MLKPGKENIKSIEWRCTDFDFYRLNPEREDLDPGVAHHSLREEETRKEEDSPEFQEKLSFNQREKAGKEP
jgi:hypothetical protein